jgi:hypothetical protein
MPQLSGNEPILGLNRSKFSEHNFVGYNIVFSMLFNRFGSIQQTFCVGNSLQGRSLE